MEAETTTAPKPLHAVVFPIPLQGHVIPAVNLAIRLATKGFTITFVNTQLIHHQITKSLPNPNTTQNDIDDEVVDIFSGAREAGLDIRYRTVSDGFPLSFNRMLNHDQYLREGHMGVLPIHMDELVRELVESADPTVSVLIADTFFGWQSNIAKKYDLVSVSFWTEPAIVFSLYYHLDLLKVNGHYGAFHDNREDIIDYIPGVKAIEPNDLPSYLQELDVSTIMHGVINNAFEGVKRADMILCNTVHELEFEPISTIQKRQPMYAIGPLISSGSTNSLVPMSIKPVSSCTQWLNSKLPNSVLYISFGSFVLCGKKDIDEIAYGLLLSKVNFIWVLRPNVVSYAEPYVLPNGFEDEIKDRGLIVTWTNQIEVISHYAIGGFLTHCGWNSVLESLWYGIPMLCFPLMTDQLTNRKLLVDDWRNGVNLCDKKPVNRFEVAEKIDHLMCGKSTKELRERTTKVKQMMKNGLTLDGSSEKNLSRFISDVKIKISDRSIM
ncbi:UDP-glycosyltransferase 86A1-like [Humulus lupulus]|uniref:UDP-glycosyltransferase 86A1-like n=1 Tax=Humulus lupulus TaxID=3486 RepID=UPI002B403444|nr:UDP-glycosyltransferase 86A1-like [Humulus lupulus]